MKRYFIFLLAFAMILTICACKREEPEGSLSITDTSAPTQSQPTTEPEETTEGTEAPEPIDNMEILTAYQMVLQEFLQEQVLPGSEKVEYDSFFGPMSDNRFAICDVDGDGMDELLLEFTTTSLAGMKAIVFGYDLESGNVTWEFLGFPPVTFYDNGAVKVEASHNQTASYNVWPFSLYKYSDGEYRMIYSVTGWDRDMESQGYPTDVDTENAGYVYIVTRDDEQQLKSKTDYETWEQETLGAEMEIYYHYLTQESIDAITGAVG